MADLSPFPLVWTDEGTFKPPTPYWAAQADKRFAVGERYLMTEHMERSINAHRHYFANLHEAWQNLPETLTSEYPSSEHLRKRALIMTGYRDETAIVCATEKDAYRVSALVQGLDEFAVIVLHQNVITIWRPKSQRMRAMGAKDFQQSKIDVLAWCWNLVGVSPEDGARNAGQSA